MSDNPLESLALGYLASGSMTETASQGALMLTRSLRERGQPIVDAGALLALASEIEKLLEQKDIHIAALQREINELRAHAKQVEADRDKLIDWSERAQAELDWRRSGT